jgi:hypothetical protein
LRRASEAKGAETLGFAALSVKRPGSPKADEVVLVVFLLNSA